MKRAEGGRKKRCKTSGPSQDPGNQAAECDEANVHSAQGSASQLSNVPLTLSLGQSIGEPTGIHPSPTPFGFPSMYIFPPPARPQGTFTQLVESFSVREFQSGIGGNKNNGITPQFFNPNMWRPGSGSTNHGP